MLKKCQACMHRCIPTLLTTWSSLNVVSILWLATSLLRNAVSTHADKLYVRCHESSSIMSRGREDIRFVCEHCNSHLSTKTFRTHKSLYFNNATNTWIKKFCSDDSHEEWDDDDDSHLFETTLGSDAHHNPLDDDPPPVVDFSDNAVEERFSDGMSIIF